MKRLRSLLLRLFGHGLTPADLRHHIRVVEQRRARLHRKSLALAHEINECRAQLAAMERQ